jgi:hypothetical protein
MRYIPWYHDKGNVHATVSDEVTDSDSPWKEAIERYFPRFMAFCFALSTVDGVARWNRAIVLDGTGAYRRGTNDAVYNKY